MATDPNAFSRYMAAQESTRRRMAEYEAASARLDLARIRERLTEIQSQHEPLASRTESGLERERHISTALYVVTGRW